MSKQEKSLRQQVFEFLDRVGEATAKEIREHFQLSYPVPNFVQAEEQAGRLAVSIYPTESGRDGPKFYRLSRAGRRALVKGTVDSEAAKRKLEGRGTRGAAYFSGKWSRSKYGKGKITPSVLKAKRRLAGKAKVEE